MTRRAKPQLIKISMMSKMIYCLKTHDTDEEGQLDKFPLLCWNEILWKENLVCVKKIFFICFGGHSQMTSIKKSDWNVTYMGVTKGVPMESLSEICLPLELTISTKPWE